VVWMVLEARRLQIPFVWLYVLGREGRVILPVTRETTGYRVGNPERTSEPMSWQARRLK
jgi:hypothetical protein